MFAGATFRYFFEGAEGVGWCVEANFIYITNRQNFQLVIQLKVKKEREREGEGERGGDRQNLDCIFDLVDS